MIVVVVVFVVVAVVIAAGGVLYTCKNQMVQRHFSWSSFQWISSVDEVHELSKCSFQLISSLQDFPYQHNLLVILFSTQFCSNGHRAVDKPIFHSTQMFWVVNKCTSLDLWVIRADHCSSEICEPWLLKVLSQISMTCKSTSTSLSVNCTFIVCLKECSSAVGKNQSNFFTLQACSLSPMHLEGVQQENSRNSHP